MTRDPARPSLRQAVAALKRQMVAEAIRRNEGNICKSARQLGISRPTLYGLIEEFQLAVEPLREKRE